MLDWGMWGWETGESKVFFFLVRMAWAFTGGFWCSGLWCLVVRQARDKGERLM